MIAWVQYQFVREKTPNREQMISKLRAKILDIPTQHVINSHKNGNYFKNLRDKEIISRFCFVKLIILMLR